MFLFLVNLHRLKWSTVPSSQLHSVRYILGSDTRSLHANEGSVKSLSGDQIDHFAPLVHCVETGELTSQTQALVGGGVPRNPLARNFVGEAAASSGEEPFSTLCGFVETAGLVPAVEALGNKVARKMLPEVGQVGHTAVPLPVLQSLWL